MNQAWKIVLSAIIAAVIAGGGVYYWQKKSQPLIINQEGTSPIEEHSKIIQEISSYCEKYKIPKCLPIKSYSVVDFDEKYSVVKIDEFNYLLTKNDNKWNVSIVSQEKNICETGSDNADLAKYCKQ